MISDLEIGKLAERHNISPAAVRELAAAMQRGNRTLAQFNHPDLGGMGQWMGGGALMIGDMFNDTLKGRVRALCDDLVKAEWPEESSSAAHRKASSQSSSWWPSEFGRPSSVGSQNASRYAFFPEARRLVIDSGDGLTIYDTGDEVITGAGQQQSGTSSMRFSTSSGTVDLASLKRIS